LWWGPQCQSSYSLSKLSLIGSCEKIWKLEIHRLANNKKQSPLHLACTKLLQSSTQPNFFATTEIESRKIPFQKPIEVK
jgi:hypothetical protein